MPSHSHTRSSSGWRYRQPVLCFPSEWDEEVPWFISVSLITREDWDGPRKCERAIQCCRSGLAPQLDLGPYRASRGGGLRALRPTVRVDKEAAAALPAEMPGFHFLPPQ